MSNIYYDLIEIITVVSYGRDRTGLYDTLDQSMKWAPFERRRRWNFALRSLVVLSWRWRSSKRSRKTRFAIIAMTVTETCLWSTWSCGPSCLVAVECMSMSRRWRWAVYVAGLLTTIPIQYTKSQRNMPCDDAERQFTSLAYVGPLWVDQGPRITSFRTKVQLPGGCSAQAGQVSACGCVRAFSGLVIWYNGWSALKLAAELSAWSLALI